MPRRVQESERVEHFWSKVNKGGPVVRPELGPCWDWTDHLTDRGYGQYFVYRRPVYAHVYAYTLTHGRPKQKVLHHCDRKPCVRPDHLYDGTQKQNMRDAVGRGRVPHGDGHYRTKLSDATVEDLRRRYPEGFPMGVRARLAASLGVAASHLGDVVHGRKRRQSCRSS